MSILLLENYIKNILSENTEFIKKLHVYDFDSTLYDNENNMWIERVVDNAKKSIQDLDTLAVLCTARIKKPDVINKTSGLLKDKGLHFANKFFMPETFPGSTPQYKTDVIKKLLNSYYNISEVVFWEDNLDNLNYAKNILKSLEIKYCPIIVK